MSTLTDILPTTKPRLIDLVKAAGIDVRDWKNFKEGAKPKKAAANPRYCYEWGFIKPNHFVIQNLWHDFMQTGRDGVIFINVNHRRVADRCKGTEHARALRADELLRKAAKNHLPIRVIVLGGRRRENPKEKASRVSTRLLDPISWRITAHNQTTGDYRLSRGDVKFVDQFSIQNETGLKPKRHKVSGLAWGRSPVVRCKALQRAQGKCEWCGKPGFIMAGGGVYLETHHVVQLSEKGIDAESNVAALCPNHHREAHHGETRTEMRKKLLIKLRSHVR